VPQVRSIRPREAPPALKALDPGAARWIGTLIRISAPHPAMGRILDVIERLQDRPFLTNFLLLGESGTGKDGLGRALHQLIAPRGPMVRLRGPGPTAGHDDAFFRSALENAFGGELSSAKEAGMQDLGEQVAQSVEERAGRDGSGTSAHPAENQRREEHREPL